MNKIGKISIAVLTFSFLLFISGGAACKSKTYTNASDTEIVSPDDDTRLPDKDTEKHEHVFDEINYGMDETCHWLNAICHEGVTDKVEPHVYDNDSDTDCNVCGYKRTVEKPAEPDPSPEEPPLPPDQPETPPEEPPRGFEIEVNADSLIIEGVSAKYELNERFKAVDTDSLDLYVYSSVNGEKGKAIPTENYQLTLYYGQTKLENGAELTDEGTYSIVASLHNAYRAGGDKIPDGEITGKAEFTVSNPLTKLELISGKTLQTSSETDKLSSTWQFSAIRANGEKFTVPSAQISIPALDTKTVGTHRVTVAYGEISAEVSYEISPLTVIHGVRVKLKDNVVTEISGDFLTLDLNDFDVDISVSGEYSAQTEIFYGGGRTEKLVLAPSADPHEITVSVTVAYMLDGEKVTATYEEHINITVTKAAQEPSDPVPDDKLSFDGAEMGGLLSSGYAVKIENQEGFSVVAGSSGITVTRNGFDDFTGLKFKTEKAAKIILKAESVSAAVALFAGEEPLIEAEAFEGEFSFEAEVTDAGEYNFVFIFLSDDNPAILLSHIEIIYI